MVKVFLREVYILFIHFFPLCSLFPFFVLFFLFVAFSYIFFFVLLVPECIFFVFLLRLSLSFTSDCSRSQRKENKSLEKLLLSTHTYLRVVWSEFSCFLPFPALFCFLLNQRQPKKIILQSRKKILEIFWKIFIFKSGME